MTTLLIHPYFLCEDPVELRVMKPYPPLGLMYLSAWLKQDNLPVEVFDGTFLAMEDLETRLTAMAPAVAALYATLMSRHNVLKVIAFIRANPALKETVVVVGGPDSRHHAQGYLGKGADVVIPGEGEVPLAEVSGAVALNRKATINTIPGVITLREDGNAVENPPPLQLDPAKLPLPDRDAFDMAAYLDTWKQHHGFSTVTINTMRGCPYACNWCSKPVFGNTCRRRPVDSVIGELRHVMERYNPDQIWFTDDVFTLSHDWLEGYTLGVESAGIVTPFECISRSDRLDNGILDLLKRAGCRKLWIGAESGSQRVIGLMNRKIDITRTVEVMNQARECGISTGSFIMCGYPGEKIGDILQTAKFIRDAAPHEMTLGMAYPIIGTRFFEETEGSFSKPYVWELFNERQIRLKRPYTDRFYRNALRFLRRTHLAVVAVNSRQVLSNRLQAFILKNLMYLTRWL